MIRLDATKREALRKAKADIAELLRPEREAAKIKARTDKRARNRGLVRTEGQRQPRVREPLYLAFLRRQPCLKCGRSPCDPAHIRFVPHGSDWRYTGKAEKPDDWRASPLCREHHDLQHSMKEERFWSEVLGLDPMETVARLRAEYLGEKS